MSILANSYIPPRMLAGLKRASGWRSGGLINRTLSLDGNLTGSMRSRRRFPDGAIR